MGILHHRRLTCVRAVDEKELEVKIFEAARDATLRLRKAEQLLEAIRRSHPEESPAHARLRESLSFKLANDIQELAKQLRTQQRAFIDQRRQFEATEKVSFLELAAEHELEGGEDWEWEITDEAMLDLQGRHQEISQIVQSIHQLNDIYKELSQMVILQGSLLDRIDENVTASREAVAKGMGHLVKAEKHQKKTGRCACGVMVVLLVAISILLVVLLSRWLK